MADSATFNDPVNPHHYKSREIECIELVELLPFCEGNAVKYLWRAGLKGPALEDYKKALWYVNRARAGKALMAHRPRPFNWILQRALTEFSDETIRQTIKTIALGKLAIAVEYLEELIARASAVPPHTSNLEECTASFAR